MPALYLMTLAAFDKKIAAIAAAAHLGRLWAQVELRLDKGRHTTAAQHRLALYQTNAVDAIGCGIVSNKGALHHKRVNNQALVGNEVRCFHIIKSNSLLIDKDQAFAIRVEGRLLNHAACRKLPWGRLAIQIQEKGSAVIPKEQMASGSRKGQTRQAQIHIAAACLTQFAAFKRIHSQTCRLGEAVFTILDHHPCGEEYAVMGQPLHGKHRQSKFGLFLCCHWNQYQARIAHTATAALPLQDKPGTVTLDL